MRDWHSPRGDTSHYTHLPKLQWGGTAGTAPPWPTRQCTTPPGHRESGRWGSRGPNFSTLQTIKILGVTHSNRLVVKADGDALTSAGSRILHGSELAAAAMPDSSSGLQNRAGLLAHVESCIGHLNLDEWFPR